MRAVVTAGGTSEPIDDVRVITNFSTGRFGAAIANALARRGHEVVLLAGRALASHPEWIEPGVRVVPFGSFADLDRALDEATATPPDLLFMAAAVSDYTPVRTPGKMRSDRDEVTVVLRRNPKLLAKLRERCPEALLVGFKLLSGVSEDELVAVARRQLVDNRLDAVVANDLQQLAGPEHPVVLVAGDGEERRSGTKEAVASWLVDKVEGVLGVPRRPLAAIRGQQLFGFDVIGVPTATVATRDPGEIERALARAAWDGEWDGGPFVLKIGAATVVGGDLLVFGAKVERLLEPSRAELSRRGIDPGSRFVPLVDRGRPVGVAVPLAEGLYVPLEHLDEPQRDRIVQSLGSRRVVAVAGELWTEHGWAVRGEVGGLAILEPPSPEGRVEAASICLLDPVGRRVLIGLRRTPPWEGYWAFPGGRRHPGEDLLATALRELEEETGIRIDRPRPVRERRVFVGADPGFVVTNFVVPVLEVPRPAASPELDARWVDLGELPTLRPMAGGTRLVLAGIDRMRW